MTFTHSEMALELQKLVWSKTTWLSDHGSKRPYHEVETRKRELAVLEQAAAMFERAAKKQEEAA
ncbi:hypothetical protein [Chelativorans sp. Marseille-P2723]|uniref:hypothetical protein n=1 Tax=Chelativorans sp. Marseille-P2723 TaxID=2709133 RepID=UPI00156EE51D|nr:hypothetical protein [Chelativorans sp. Marseille-P2723]